MTIDLIIEGGPILWIIMFFGIVALGVFVERSWHLHRARIKADDFIKGIVNVITRGNTTEALTLCEDTPGPVAYIVRTAILHREESRESLRDALEEAGKSETSRMERRLFVLATIAQVSPLMGLLGTVVGMVGAMLVMKAQAPLIDTVDVISGLMTALVTTGAGLIVAIPCYGAFNLLVLKIDRIVLDMERAGSEIIAFLKEPAAQAEIPDADIPSE